MSASRAKSTLRQRLAHEAGTSLIEIVMAAALLAVVAVGVMSGLDVSARVSGDQKGKAIAGNLAQDEIERIRALDFSQLPSVNGTPVIRTEGGVNYTVTSTATWVANQAGDTFACDVEGGTTYLKLRVSVKWPGSDRAVVLESIFAPGVRNVVRTIGALAFRVVDQSTAPVAGVSFTLTAAGEGNRTGVTDSNGCVVWSSIPATTWQVTGTRTGFLTPNGSTSIIDEVSVPGQTFVTKQYEYARGGTISGSFFTTRPGSATPVPSMPQRYVVAHSSMNYLGNSYRVFTLGSSATTFTTPPLYPYTSAYTIWAGGCTTAPGNPAGIATPMLPAGGGNVTGQQVKLPALDVVTRDDDTRESGQIRTTICGTTYNRWTLGSGTYRGRLADPGFPYTASSVNVCAQMESRDPDDFPWVGEEVVRKNRSYTNTNYAGSLIDDPPLSLSSTFNVKWAWTLFTLHMPSNGFSNGTC